MLTVFKFLRKMISEMSIQSIFPLLLIFFSASIAQGEIVDKVVATVNQEPITLSDLNRIISNYNKEMGKLPQARQRKVEQEDLKHEALNHLIEESLLSQDMEKQGIKVTEEDVSGAIDTILKRNKLGQEGLKKELNQKGSSLEEYRKEIKEQLKRFRFIGQVFGSKIKVSQEDVNNFYEQNSDKLKDVQKIHIAQIVIPFAVEAQMKEAEKKANDIYKRAKAGANFDQLMKQEGGEGSGDLGEVSMAGISPQIAPAIQNLDKGGVSEPVRTQAGFLVVKLIDKPEVDLKGDESIKEGIRNQIYEMKVQEELKKYVDQLKGKAFINIRS